MEKWKQFANDYPAEMLAADLERHGFIVTSFTTKEIGIASESGRVYVAIGDAICACSYRREVGYTVGRAAESLDDLIGQIRRRMEAD